MLTLYPSNRLEILSQLLQAVLSYRRSGTLDADVILVESQGMQHWLNMELAQHQGVAMNLEFPMPSRFIWDTARIVLGDSVPRQSLFRREVMVWKLEQLLADEATIAAPQCAPLLQYWQDSDSSQGQLKRYQLAAKVADLFEQYLIYRSDWLQQWQQGTVADDADEQWQAYLWQALLADAPEHPAALQQRAIAEIESNFEAYAARLPKQISLFAINAMAPQSLQFFQVLAQHIDVHLFHLNPCVDFWGELQSDKSQAKAIRQQQYQQWLDAGQSNPLLANLGQQGKDLFNGLQQLGVQEIAAFNDATRDVDNTPENDSLLACVQRDILNLSDARERPRAQAETDDSIVFHSCHSALREIQALHDQLLHLFNADPALVPSDVLVMCPRIEDYAPYVDAVFRKPWEHDEVGQAPRLPCSIADRTLLDSEPMVNALLNILQLPDSRFEVNQILEYLRVPSLQRRFGLIDSELETIEYWLQQACIHWGLNQQHQQQIAGASYQLGTYSWQWGLTRLLQGFASGQDLMVDDVQWLPIVDGQQGVLLGRLMQILEQLQWLGKQLQQPRSAEQWRHFIEQSLTELFDEQEDEQYVIDHIHQVLAEFVGACEQSDYQGDIELSVFQHYLSHHFSQPDTGNHFMTGQVTFCSMVPMRSIPFKVIAILGLNDGVFPRQSNPLSFDLMARHGRRQGDRSRRGDDRYLFLEALISARQHLILSYQGRDSKDNNERQPSLVLAELMDYLTYGYGWQFERDVKQQPLHPFSARLYQPAAHQTGSFEAGWMRLAQHIEPKQRQLVIDTERQPAEPVTATDLIQCLIHPLRYLARQRLQLYLDIEQRPLSDSEPFAVDALMRFDATQRLLQAQLAEQSVSAVKQALRGSGQLPNTPLIDRELDQWSDRACHLAAAITDIGMAPLAQYSVRLGDIEISADLHWQQQQQGIICYHPGSDSAGQLVKLWIHHLLASSVATQPLRSVGLYLDSKTDQVICHQIPAAIAPEQAAQLLHQLLEARAQVLSQPLPLFCRLAQGIWQSQPLQPLDDKLADGSVSKAWRDCVESKPFAPLPGLDQDPYFQWFYQHEHHYPVPSREVLALMETIYQPMYQALLGGQGASL
ncbi:RecBCD enzyme subunit RecC [Neiella marina]|uniref:RecBCD enzyme subunit RecC n=1 Tax=Neiella marina TaxID=508461 RepID=A0A8J2XN25_9GAMM|nr:exodeoxyribonuclease V subunit gamma [Neiella marina]GGA69808.1 RecBCD enzyme subunit RecC [Neiella marina]